MSTSGEIVRSAFDNWMSGTGSVTNIFAPDMTWEIVGLSAASAKYSTAQTFQDEVLTPFAQHFNPNDPLRRAKIRGFYVDGDTVIVFWDGAGTTVVGSISGNRYAWIMTLDNGLVVEGTAFYDGISFNEPWKIDPDGA